MPLTFTGPAVALPAISRTLGGSPLALNWVTNAFMLTFGSTLMAAGALADSYGRKRMFLGGLAAFGLFSLGLAFANDIVLFDILRALQGVGAAAAFSGGMASLAQEFEEGQRLRAFSVVGASFGVGLAFGPIASGLVVEALGWPAIFLLVVALAAFAFALGAVFLRETRDPNAGGLDWKGAVTFTLALAFLTFGILQLPEAGWSDPFVLAVLVAAVVFFFVFYRIERSVARPMLDLSLFKYPRFVGVQLLAAAPAYGFVVLLILLPVRFIGIEGMSEIAGGADDDCALGSAAPPADRRRSVDALVCAGRHLRDRIAGFSRRAWLAQPVSRGLGAGAAGPTIAARRHRHQPALGFDGWAGGQRGAEGAGGNGDGYLQHHPCCGRRDRPCGGDSASLCLHADQIGVGSRRPRRRCRPEATWLRPAA
ncbi:MFS transporter [Ensifer sp. 1H6]|uniref:MFS transporter n=1 Tax=Ensifer sp. 1H6 TaxID=1911585 RepID=UPI0032AFC54F